MPTEVHYEIHVRDRDKWTAIGTATAEADAREQANVQIRRKPHQSLRILREAYNTETTLTSGRIIFEHEPASSKSQSGMRSH